MRVLSAMCVVFPVPAALKGWKGAHQALRSVRSLGAAVHR